MIDLAEAHLKALQYLIDKNRSDSFNLGNGEGHSVREIIEKVRKVTRRDFEVVEVGRREGDPSVLIGSSEKAKEVLHWRPQYESIETIIETAWRWHKRSR